MNPEEPALLAASRAEYLTPLERFGPSRHVYGRVHQAGSDVYLLVAPRLGPGDPVAAVGWARNDYWAVQVRGFDGYGYRCRTGSDRRSLGTPPGRDPCDQPREPTSVRVVPGT